jgi:hypothetical protein
VCVLELHDPAPPPPVGGRPGVAVDGDDLVAAPRQHRGRHEPGRAGTDHEDVHDDE